MAKLHQYILIIRICYDCMNMLWAKPSLVSCVIYYVNTVARLLTVPIQCNQNSSLHAYSQKFFISKVTESARAPLNCFIGYKRYKYQT